MANAFAVSKGQLIYALCLPLAVLLGYMLADPTDVSSLLIFMSLIGVLSIPVMLRWHHLLLVASWNAAIAPVFLPGAPMAWILMAAASLGFALLNRAISAETRFLHVPAVTKSLLFLAAVVVVTGLMTGGFGIRSLGSETYGGKRFVYVLMAIVGYFAFSTQRIPVEQSNRYVAIFFLSSLTALIGLAYLAGPAFYFVFDFIPLTNVMEQAQSQFSDAIFVRYTSLILPTTGVYSFLLARYGLKGVLDASKPWRLVLFVAAIVGCFYTGFRSYVILMGLTGLGVFLLEKMWRTRLLPVLASVVIVGGIVVVAASDQLPLVVQRSVSFLPVKLDPMIKQSAESSSEWRLEMWRSVLPQIPRYLIKGKGYALDPNDIFLARESTMRGFAPLYNTAATTGDYHSGPLSVLIPFGIFGMIGFVWFSVAGLRLLIRNFRYGDPALIGINRFLLAAFAAKLVFFVSVFGSLSVDLCMFTGLLGMSVSLNGGMAQAPVESEEELEPEEELALG